MTKLNDLQDKICQHQDHRFVRQAKYYIWGRRDLLLKIGDLVKKPLHTLSRKQDRFASKLASLFHGPFMEVKIVSPNVYELSSTGSRLVGRYHASHLQSYYALEEDLESTDSENERTLDRKLFDINWSDPEPEVENKKREDNYGTVGNPEVSVEPSRRRRLRNRSYSY